MRADFLTLECGVLLYYSCVILLNARYYTSIPAAVLWYAIKYDKLYCKKSRTELVTVCKETLCSG